MPDYPPPPPSIPDDRTFGPRDPNQTTLRAADSTAALAATTALPAGGVLMATNAQRITYAEAQAQYLANALNCGIKTHYEVVPPNGYTGPAMRVDFIADQRTKDPSTVAAPT